MEASTIPATAALQAGRASGARIAAGPLLRLRSDEQLVALFRAGNDEAFRVIHDRYRQRLFAYARQMLGGSRARTPRTCCRTCSCAPTARCARTTATCRCAPGSTASRTTAASTSCAARVAAAAARCSSWCRAPAARPDRRGRAARVAAAPGRRRAAAARAAALGAADARDRRDGLRGPGRPRSDVTVPAVKSLLVRARIGLAQARGGARHRLRGDPRRPRRRARARRARERAGAPAHARLQGLRRLPQRAARLDARFAALVPAHRPARARREAAGHRRRRQPGVAGSGAGGAAVRRRGRCDSRHAAPLAVGITHIAAAVAVAVVSAGGARRGASVARRAGPARPPRPGTFVRRRRRRRRRCRERVASAVPRRPVAADAAIATSS